MGHFIQVYKAGAQAGQSALALVIIFDRADCRANEIFDGGRLALAAFFTDLENVALDFIEQRVDFALMLIDPRDHSTARLDHAAKSVLLAHNPDVKSQISR